MKDDDQLPMINVKNKGNANAQHQMEEESEIGEEAMTGRSSKLKAESSKEKSWEVDSGEIRLAKEIRAKKYDNITLWGWSREGFDRYKDFVKDCLMKLELPLINGENKNFGTLWIIKDLRRDSISHYTLRRVEHLRRSLIGAMEKLSKGGS